MSAGEIPPWKRAVEPYTQFVGPVAVGSGRIVVGSPSQSRVAFGFLRCRRTVLGLSVDPRRAAFAFITK